MSKTPTKEMVEAFHKAYDASLEMQPRETSQAIYDGLSAALQSAADTPAPQEHLAGTPEVEHMRQKAISNARERNAALRAIQAALDDFELIVDRINAGQINRACATAMQGAKEAKLALAASAPDTLSPFKAKEE
jgi:hypothetical protein